MADATATDAASRPGNATAAIMHDVGDSHDLMGPSQGKEYRASA